MKSYRVVICSVMMLLFMFAPVGVYADHVHKVELPYGEFTATSDALKVDAPSVLRLQVINAEDSAGKLYYMLYQMKRYTSVDEEGNEEVVKCDEAISRGIVRLGGDATIEKEVGPGKYYVELSTSLWMPGISTPTCHGEATLTRVDR